MATPVTPEQIDQAHSVVSTGLRLALAYRGYSTGDVAARMGLKSGATVAAHLSGRRLPKEETVLQYAKALNMPFVMIYVLGALDFDKLCSLMKADKET